ncbi:hypothetical protein ACHAW5_010614 [Stephanodiscus triporus]|uniref:Uncharacterized protein n=1 Tax=Stephanodiscus triporus TaxID=2934178 RepID=A0ABD3NTU3_9STRA
MRSLLKMGDGHRAYSRIVDSMSAVEVLYPPDSRRRDNVDIDIDIDIDIDGRMSRRTIAARVLAEDSSSGGRFRRRSCQFVSARYERGVRRS